MRKAGIGVLAAACLSGCNDNLPPVVWEGETERSDQGFASCLKRSGAFDELRKMAAGAYSPHVDTKAYLAARNVTIVLPETFGSPQRVFARSESELTQGEILALQECSLA